MLVVVFWGIVNRVCYKMNDNNGIINSLPIFEEKLDPMEKTYVVIVWFSKKILEVATNGVPELAQNANNAHKVIHKDAKKKDCKTALCIQSAVDTMNFDRTSHAESTKEAFDIIAKYYEGGEKIKVQIADIAKTVGFTADERR